MGLSEHATEIEIRKKFAYLSKLKHPDKNLDNPNSKEEYQKVVEAYLSVKNYAKSKQAETNLDSEDYKFCSSDKVKDTQNKKEESKFYSSASQEWKTFSDRDQDTIRDSLKQDTQTLTFFKMKIKSAYEKKFLLNFADYKEHWESMDSNQQKAFSREILKIAERDKVPDHIIKMAFPELYFQNKNEFNFRSDGPDLKEKESKKTERITQSNEKTILEKRTKGFEKTKSSDSEFKEKANKKEKTNINSDPKSNFSEAQEKRKKL